MTNTGAVLIIGGGHNGLACAAYLARAGRPVTVIEAAERVGGMAATREFVTGYRASCAHLLYLLDESVAGDLSLANHGLRLAATELQTVALDPGGEHLLMAPDGLEGGGLGDRDRAAWPEYQRRMSKFAAYLGTLRSQAPPRITNRREDLLALGALAWRLRRMGRDDMREFLRIAGINIHDLLNEHFDSSLLKGALGFDAVLGAFAGPRSNNTVFTALHRRSGAGNGYSVVEGGMGAVTDALAAAATAAGATIRTGVRVQRIESDGLTVSGVELDDGERLAASTIVSNADPKTTMLKLLGARHLEAETARRFHRLRTSGCTAKLHLALDGLPEISGLAAEHLDQRLLIAPGPGYLDRAFNPCKYGEFSRQPAMEIILPSVVDPSLAPSGRHVLSAVVQYAPYRLEGGWEAGKPAFLEAILDTLEGYAPGIRPLIVGSELLTPPDLENLFGATGGHWHHAELSLDQFLMLRPAPRAAQYRMPVDGLYLCSAGCHPGGGVMGSAGRNAARAVLGGAKK
ncbi:MAG: NAD(P)/FAD-dependent oxidoreductase [Gammaproteobacteria bacterium]|nr:NAD(P)/FAD-dependent oxidoreductase [Gammaproteobacteria bacterium]